ncbi:putative oxygenase MesX [Halioxenophilus aromaticivorans]|uniref:DUF1852 domain-containing protein n=1 Tax=Halioxenophilus aromaticivorans TaxID=1306992 RepID=A0AAV3U4R7_9ALTE
MTTEFQFSITCSPFNEQYQPCENTRTTTNFANLARGHNRVQNLRAALRMIDNRFNALAHWDNPNQNRYRLALDIVSVAVGVAGQNITGDAFPNIEMLNTHIVDTATNKRLPGVVGNNFSSYVRDYDFSILLPSHNTGGQQIAIPKDFGALHGKLFQALISSQEYQQQFTKLPVICLSVSSAKRYRRLSNQHPILGVEYEVNESSLTEQYFEKMGLQVRYFMPPNSVAPLAFYFIGDLLTDYTNLELISTISTMETFQKIYRPEIYNANSVAGANYQPSLDQPDHSLTGVVYDREERSQLAVEQGKFAEANFIKPYQAQLKQQAAGRAH